MGTKPTGAAASSSGGPSSKPKAGAAGASTPPPLSDPVDDSSKGNGESTESNAALLGKISVLEAENETLKKQKKNNTLNANIQSDLSSEKANNAALHGEIDKLKEELVTSNQKNAELQETNNQLTEKLRTVTDTELPVEHLGKGDHALKESATFSSEADDGKSMRTNGRRGDVVTTDKSHVNKLAAKLGIRVRVYHVTAATVAELQKYNCI